VAAFRRGDLDVALLPTYDVLLHAAEDAAVVADGVSISSRGEVFSVFLAHRIPLDEIREIVPDPESVTSNSLGRVLTHALLPPGVRWVPGGDLDRVGAGILIGDRAIAFRRSLPKGWEVLDFGRAWMELTGLPFVFAAWLISSRVPDPVAVARHLREACANGLARIDELIADQHDEAFAHRYLGGYIRYDLGAGEKAGLGEFAARLSALGELPAATASRLRFV